MKKWLFIFICCNSLGFVLSAQTTPSRYAIFSEFSNRKVGIGFQYVIRERWGLPLTIGVSNEFFERKWNDWYVDFQPFYLLGKRKVQFPIGLLGGIRFMNDYTHHFPVFFGGVYGGVLYRLGHHGVGVNIGVKYGKRSHLLKHEEQWGTVSAYETYRERPLFFSVRYQFSF